MIADRAGRTQVKLTGPWVSEEKSCLRTDAMFPLAQTLEQREWRMR